MRLLNLLVLTIMFLFSACVGASAEIKDVTPLPTPLMRTASPEAVKAGATATVAGDYLDKSRVAEVYLTNGKVDAKVDVIEQARTELKFKVPEKIVVGRYNLMVLMVGEEPKLIEEPARLTVVE
jgi:uncharacterized protein YqfA (UPF0365 family)